MQIGPLDNRFWGPNACLSITSQCLGTPLERIIGSSVALRKNRPQPLQPVFGIRNNCRLLKLATRRLTSRGNGSTCRHIGRMSGEGGGGT